MHDVCSGTSRELKSEKSLNTLKICIMYQLKDDVDKLNAVKVVVS